jgi:threonine/homoserine/homoserine lactone efflux protein
MRDYLPLILFCFSSSITPGPNNLMIMMSGLNYGVRRSLAHFLGINAGFILMLLIVGLGLGSIFEAFPLLHRIIKIVGSLYILYLAIKTIFASTQIKAQAGKRPVGFWQAVLFQWANPKAWVMSIGVFAAFSLPLNNIMLQVGLVTMVFGIILLPCIALWLFGGVIMRSVLHNEHRVRLFNVLMGLLLIASIVLMIIH